MYIIDGYNLLWSIHKTVEHFEEITQAQLCRLVAQYLKADGLDGLIVFDGVGPPDKRPLQHIANLEVLFSGPNADADDVIEARLKADTAPKRLTVVSSDRRIRTAVKAAKATSIKSEQFCRILLSRAKARKAPAEPVQKKQGLDEGQTKQWLKYFGLDQ
jgi:predicted RNA-binding protein with PIN domain